MENGTCIDLVQNFCFKDACAFETGLSDCNRLIMYSKLTTIFKNEKNIKEILLIVVTRTLTKETFSKILELGCKRLQTITANFMAHLNNS